MAINNGDFVRLNFTGKIKETGVIFDTTYEDVAKDAEIYAEEKTYNPIPIVVGATHILPIIEKEIEGLEAGDSKTIEMESKDAFGDRRADLIQLIPMKEFKKQGMTPFPGMLISVDNKNGKVLTVSGGRVKVDFNHQLAGKDLIYDVDIIEIIENDEDKIKSLIDLHSSNIDIDKTEIDIDGDVVNITLDELTKLDQRPYVDITVERYRIAKDIEDNMDIVKVNFIDSFEKNTDEYDEEE